MLAASLGQLKGSEGGRSRCRRQAADIGWAQPGHDPRHAVGRRLSAVTIHTHMASLGYARCAQYVRRVWQGGACVLDGARRLRCAGCWRKSSRQTTRSAGSWWQPTCPVIDTPLPVRGREGWV